MANYAGRHIELLQLKRYTGDNTSNPEMNGLLGAADRVIVHAIVNDYESTPTPQLQLTAEDSSDGENWAALSQSVIPTTTLITAPSVFRGEVEFPHGRYLRLTLRIQGLGTSTSAYANVALRASLKNA